MVKWGPFLVTILKNVVLITGRPRKIGPVTFGVISGGTFPVQPYLIGSVNRSVPFILVMILMVPRSGMRPRSMRKFTFAVPSCFRKRRLWRSGRDGKEVTVLIPTLVPVSPLSVRRRPLLGVIIGLKPLFPLSVRWGVLYRPTYCSIKTFSSLYWGWRRRRV